MENAFESCKNYSARLLQAHDVPLILNLFYRPDLENMRYYNVSNLVDLKFNAEDFGSE